jgi:two-component sensor histidine kinase
MACFVQRVLYMRIPLSIIIFLIFQTVAFAQRPINSNDSTRMNFLFQKSHTDSINKNYLSALRHLNQYLHLKDAVLEIAKQQQIRQLQVQYQTVRKDLEIRSREKNIHLLTNQNNLTSRNIQQARSIRNIEIVVVIAAALLLALSFLQYRLKKLANLRLENQQNAINLKNDSLQYLAKQKDLLLEEKELLIKEIHHRVKNNLQVVISLLNTQSAYLNDPKASAAIRQSQHRMQSISLIHQKLYQSESRALINMKEYTQELVQYLQQSFETGTRIAFKLEIADIDLDVLRAVPLGLILNEAITNAIKHAFPAGGEGFIKIELNCINGDLLKLSVTDNGTGLPPEFSIDICQSLGINLIKGMCKQISGRLALENGKGLFITIEFPMDVKNSQLNDGISSNGDVGKSS